MIREVLHVVKNRGIYTHHQMFSCLNDVKINICLFLSQKPPAKVNTQKSPEIHPHG
jgi:hypothetical protein